MTYFVSLTHTAPIPLNSTTKQTDTLEKSLSCVVKEQKEDHHTSCITSHGTERMNTLYRMVSVCLVSLTNAISIRFYPDLYRTKSTFHTHTYIHTVYIHIQTNPVTFKLYKFQSNTIRSLQDK